MRSDYKGQYKCRVPWGGAGETIRCRVPFRVQSTLGREGEVIVLERQAIPYKKHSSLYKPFENISSTASESLCEWWRSWTGMQAGLKRTPQIGGVRGSLDVFGRFLFFTKTKVVPELGGSGRKR